MADATLTKLHRIIHNASFEVDEILRRRQQHQDDLENLEQELEKARADIDSIEKDVFYANDQLVQANCEHDRLSRLADDTEREKKILEEQIPNKERLLDEENEKRDHEETDHLIQMKDWRERDAACRKGWEKMPWMCSMRSWQQRVVEERAMVEDLKKSHPLLFAALEKRNVGKELLRKAGSVSSFFVDFAARMIRYSAETENVENLGARLQEVRVNYFKLRRTIDKEKSELAKQTKRPMFVTRMKKIPAPPIQRSSPARPEALAKFQKCRPRHSELPRFPSTISSPPRKGSSLNTHAMMKTPQLNLPQFLTRSNDDQTRMAKPIQSPKIAASRSLAIPRNIQSLPSNTRRHLVARSQPDGLDNEFHFGDERIEESSSNDFALDLDFGSSRKPSNFSFDF